MAPEKSTKLVANRLTDDQCTPTGMWLCERHISNKINKTRQLSKQKIKFDRMFSGRASANVQRDFHMHVLVQASLKLTKWNKTKYQKYLWSCRCKDMSQPRAETKMFFLVARRYGLNLKLTEQCKHKTFTAFSKRWLTTKQKSYCNSHQQNKWRANAQMSQPHDWLRF